MQVVSKAWLLQSAHTSTPYIAKRFNAETVTNVSRNSLTNAIEKHIQDSRKGRQNYDSSQTAKRLRLMHNTSASALASRDPRAFQSYLELLTALPYDRRSRVINSVKTLTEDVDKIFQKRDEGDEIARIYSQTTEHANNYPTPTAKNVLERYRAPASDISAANSIHA